MTQVVITTGKRKDKVSQKSAENDGEKHSSGDGDKFIKRRKKAEASKVKKTDNGRSHTVSLAVCGSVIDNAQSLELATALAGQIARAAAVFQVDEVVVFDDVSDAVRPTRWRTDGVSESGGIFLARILQYLDTPQYLRKQLIPMHPHLKYSGLLPPLDGPHHPRANEWTLYREGCVIEDDSVEPRDSCLVNVGLGKPILVAPKIEINTRVTVSMGKKKLETEGKVFRAVSPEEPRRKRGFYWGYSVRWVQGLSQVLENCPFAGGYDYTIGTSERGEKVSSAAFQVPKFKHLLIVFGGPAGLEESAEMDEKIKTKDTSSLFNRYLNTCPLQGSRTIRTEEAILISLAFLQEPLWRAQGIDPFS